MDVRGGVLITQRGSCLKYKNMLPMLNNLSLGAKYGVPTGVGKVVTVLNDQAGAPVLYAYMDLLLSAPDVCARVFLGKIESLKWEDVDFFDGSKRKTERVVVELTTNMIVDVDSPAQLVTSLSSLSQPPNKLKLKRVWTVNMMKPRALESDSYSWTSNINFKRPQNQIRRTPEMEFPDDVVFPVFPFSVLPMIFNPNFSLSTENGSPGFTSHVRHRPLDEIIGNGVNPDHHFKDFQMGNAEIQEDEEMDPFSDIGPLRYRGFGATK